MPKFPEDVLIMARAIAMHQYETDMQTYGKMVRGECDTWPIVKVTAQGIMLERERCAEICRKAAGYYDAGAGSDHSAESREVGKAQALCCAAEVMRGANA